jgi:hypothetical protein
MPGVNVTEITSLQALAWAEDYQDVLRENSQRSPIQKGHRYSNP